MAADFNNLMNYQFDDLVGRIEREQEKLSGKLAKIIFKEIEHYIDNRKLRELLEYVTFPIYDEPGDSEEFDEKDMKDVVKNDLKQTVLRTIKGYTRFVIRSMHETENYSVPRIEKIPKDKILEKYKDIPEYVFDRTVRLLHSEKRLPLFGKIKKGVFRINKEMTMLFYLING